MVKKVYGFLVCVFLTIPTAFLNAAVVELTQNALIAKSELIFVGRVLEKKSHLNDIGTLIVTDYGFEIKEILLSRNGLPNETQLTLTFAGGKLENGIEHVVSEVPVFKVGDSVLLMLLGVQVPYMSPVTGSFQGSFLAGPEKQLSDGSTITPVLTGAHFEKVLKNDKGMIINFSDFVRSIKTQISATNSKESPSGRIQSQQQTADVEQYDAKKTKEETQVREGIRIVQEGGEWAHPPRQLPVFFYVMPNALSVSNPIAYWNCYFKPGSPLFEWIETSSSSSWRYGNGLNEIIGVITDETREKQLGKIWDPDMLGETFRYAKDGNVIETDIGLNANYHWGTKDFESTESDHPNVNTVYLHELGHVIGLSHATFGLSIMEEKLDPSDNLQALLFLHDIESLKFAYKNYLRDDIKDLAVYLRYAEPSLQVIPTEGIYPFTIKNVAVENLGSESRTFALYFYLVDRFTADGRGHLIDRYPPRGPNWEYLTIPASNFDFHTVNLTVNRGIPPGEYFLAVIISPNDSDDDCPDLPIYNFKSFWLGGKIRVTP